MYNVSLKFRCFYIQLGPTLLIS